MSDDYKVFVTFDNVTYRGRYSIRQSGSHIIIDGKIVGVEVDNNGNPLITQLPMARVKRPLWWDRLLGWMRGTT